MTEVAIALAGGLGAVLRFVVDGLIARRRHRRVPLGTAVINVTGSFLLGLLTSLALDHVGLSEVKSVVGTGLLGGYTTFSTASVEAVTLSMTDGPRAVTLAATHAGGMLVISMTAAALGLWLG